MLILMTKFKNAMQKNGNFEYKIRNININGTKRGCSGFVTNPANHVTVYFTTDESLPANMCRYARDTKDFVGDTNLYTATKTLDNLVSYILDLLSKPNPRYSNCNTPDGEKG